MGKNRIIAERFIKVVNDFSEQLNIKFEDFDGKSEYIKKMKENVRDVMIKNLTPQQVLKLPFDIKVHKEKFTNYLEIIMHPDGTIEYAVPSHSNKLFCIVYEKKTGKSIDYKDDNFFEEQSKFLEKNVPYNYFPDMIKWYCNETGCASLWSSWLIAPDKGLTVSQLETLNKLKEEGLYIGKMYDDKEDTLEMKELKGAVAFKFDIDFCYFDNYNIIIWKHDIANYNYSAYLLIEDKGTKELLELIISRPTDYGLKPYFIPKPVTSEELWNRLENDKYFGTTNEYADLNFKKELIKFLASR